MQNIDYNTNVSNETKSNIRMILNSTTLIAISFFLLKAIKHLFKFSLQILILSKSIITLIMYFFNFLVQIALHLTSLQSIE